MCGYIGFINCGNVGTLEKATDIIAHRGPDDKGIEWFDESNSGLGHRRLSIIDLSPLGHQPMQDGTGKYWIAFNGEVYNYINIRKELISNGVQFISESDTEVVLKAFIEWGTDSFEKLNGMFSFVIFNTESQEVFAVRDRLGVKPLYYTQVGSGLIVASEIKSIFESGLYKKEPDYFSLQTPVHYQTTPYTGFKNIYKLPGGNYMRFKLGNLNISNYWTLEFSNNSWSYGNAYETLNALLQDSVRLQMIADVPVGILLSGGLDSSIIAALMKKQTTQDIHSFTIKFKAEDLKKQGNVDDSHYAKIVADKLELKHHEILIEPDIVDLLPKMIWHMDEPLADPAAINTYLICKAARERGIFVLLNGMGGDEVFSGYRSHLACIKANGYYKTAPNLFQKTIRNTVKIFPEATKSKNLKYLRWLKSFVAIASLPPFERSLAVKNSALTKDNFKSYYAQPTINFEDSNHYIREANLFKVYNADYLTQMCINDTLVYMPDHNLTYTDKASMAASVECRPPLIDHRIVEFMFSVQPEFRINGNIQKYLLKKVSEQYLPKEIIYRPKAPFSAPMRGWLRNELNEMVQDVLSEQSLKNRGMYNLKYVRNLIVQNNKGKQDNSQLIYRLLCNELWFRTHF